jgi:hypothetical protein
VFHRRITFAFVAHSSYIATPKRKKASAKDAPQPLSVQKGKPVDTGIERVPAQQEDDAESSSSSEAASERRDPDFAPEHGYTPLVEEAPAATSRTYSLSFVIIAHILL